MQFSPTVKFSIHLYIKQKLPCFVLPTPKIESLLKLKSTKMFVSPFVMFYISAKIHLCWNVHFKLNNQIFFYKKIPYKNFLIFCPCNIVAASIFKNFFHKYLLSSLPLLTSSWIELTKIWTFSGLFNIIIKIKLLFNVLVVYQGIIIYH